MAIQTRLTQYAIGGRPYAGFVAKTEAVSVRGPDFHLYRRRRRFKRRLKHG